MTDSKGENGFLGSEKKIVAQGSLFDFSSPVVMGILNVTSDSFYDGGRYQDDYQIQERCEAMLSQGAGIIDVGGCSSRPGAVAISEKEEWKRLKKALKIIKKNFSDTVVSIDTFRSVIATKAVDMYGGCIINDISAGCMDNAMFDTIAQLKVPYIMMHMQGSPETMQDKPVYENITLDILKFFAEKIEQLQLKGVEDIIIDPGFGFGKTLEHNYEILSRLDDFAIAGLPILAGVSRKSMIYKLLKTEPEYSLNGTTALNMYALQKGASILRVHDVKEAVETVQLFEQLKH